MVAIEVKELNKTYGKDGDSRQKIALQNLSLNIPEGKIFGLLGPNGAGKSTIINILAGTVIKTSGQVKISGVDIDKNAKLARASIGIVPQELAMDSFFPLHRALEFTAGYYGIRREERKTEQILKALGLFDKKDTLPRQLSGGMKRRFLIAKAMVHSPKILILDEPTAGVDIELRHQLWEYVRKLNDEDKTTIIITTHYLEEAEQMCDELAFINHGKIIKQDKTATLLKSIGSRHLVVKFASDVGAFNLPSDLALEYKICDDSICFVLPSEGNVIDSIIRHLARQKLQILDIKVEQPDLEDIFYQIIGKSIRP